ncbi:hypothetical protein FH972_023022 [Carpinus fangiana]|uniref:RRM domain-containing protein n=1 Tax=Carpinus fangiana TaxID=176857 RepID=A0A5N6KTZ3_9ROSI|nr:hypothetical protein FH972_023022 [Carpinus fangiana]
MAEPEDLDEDLFADLYEGDDNEATPAKPAPAPVAASTPAIPSQPATDPRVNAPPQQEQQQIQQESQQQSFAPADVSVQQSAHQQAAPAITTEHGFTGTVGMKEDGKMFIGGLNWETDDNSLREYFSQFGEVLECTVMRDGPSGRSRGFGFLTFKDPKTVNIVMVKEHHLDGKIIDPKRAIPRDEQEKTAKIFVGGVSQEATEKDFENFFGQFGRVIDATLMMDKDTGRPRGFGFVTFEGEQAVEATLAGPLEILGKPIEVKRAQPRGNMSPMNGGQSNRQPYNAQEQMMFEQRKYEQQAIGGGRGGRSGSQSGGTPTSWEGMYDDVPQPNAPAGRGGRGGFNNRGGSSTPQPSAAPINAPTGPKNAGRPGANYRGGGRGGHRGFHPYSRH